MKLLGAIFIALLLLSPAVARAKDVTTGGEHISLPDIGGYKELYGANPAFDRIVKQFVPPGTSLLAVYVSDEDVDAMNADAESGMKKYVMIQTPAQPVDVSTPEKFNAAKSSLAGLLTGGSLQNDKGVQDVFAGASEYIRNELNKDVRLKAGEMKFLGKFMDKPGAFGILVLANVGVKTGPDQQEFVITAAMSTLAVRGQLLYVLVYRDYNSSADIGAVRALSERYTDDTLAANGGAFAMPAGGAGAADDMDEDSFVVKLAIGAAVAVAFVLLGPRLFALLRRKDDAV